MVFSCEAVLAELNLFKFVVVVQCLDLKFCVSFFFLILYVQIR